MADRKGDGKDDGAAPIHLCLQGKGGVGKSLVASILAQYLVSRGYEVKCIDTDPINRTFSQYKALRVEHLQLLRDGTIDRRRFDDLMERLLTEESGVFVIDNGASTFIPLWKYIVENSVVDVLQAAGRDLFVHTVITGGQALFDTLDGFRQLAANAIGQNIIVWVNEYFGRVERDGKPFSEMAVYREHADRVLGSVGIPQRSRDTFGKDVEEMITDKLTFDEAIGPSAYSIMVKQRLRTIQRDLFEQLDRLSLA
jgi:CobQ/CobB/MinD/ParA nucleotide binding domain